MSIGEISAPNKAKIIVTGADGLARDIAERFASMGASVFVCDQRKEAIQSLTSANGRIWGTVADVGEEEDVKNFVAEVVDEVGYVDYLINVVGIAGPTSRIEDVTAEQWLETLNVNLTSMFFTTKAVVPIMKARGVGGIVNFSTASTRTLIPNRAPYIVSKYGVEGLTRTLARELGPFNIRVNAILPGGIIGERLRKMQEKSAKDKGRSLKEVIADNVNYVSMRTFIEPEEVVDLVQFLCSVNSKHITGQLIGVCGNLEWET